MILLFLLFLLLQAVQAALIFDNPYTQYSMEVRVHTPATCVPCVTHYISYFLGAAFLMGWSDGGHQPSQQRDREPDPHPRLQGTQRGSAKGVSLLLQPL